MKPINQTPTYRTLNTNRSILDIIAGRPSERDRRLAEVRHEVFQTKEMNTMLKMNLDELAQRIEYEKSVSLDLYQRGENDPTCRDDVLTDLRYHAGVQNRLLNRQDLLRVQRDIANEELSCLELEEGILTGEYYNIGNLEELKRKYEHSMAQQTELAQRMKCLVTGITGSGVTTHHKTSSSATDEYSKSVLASWEAADRLKGRIPDSPMNTIVTGGK